MISSDKSEARSEVLLCDFGVERTYGGPIVTWLPFPSLHGASRIELMALRLGLESSRGGGIEGVSKEQSRWHCRAQILVKAVERLALDAVRCRAEDIRRLSDYYTLVCGLEPGR